MGSHPVAGPLLGYYQAGFLHCIAQKARGLAHDRVAFTIEDDDFVVPRDHVFAALVIEQNNIVGFVLVVVDDDLRAALIESLDDFGGLRALTTTSGAAEAVDGPARCGFHFPRLAISDVNPRAIGSKTSGQHGQNEATQKE